MPCLAYAGGKPEGYLFPATYAVQPHETARGVLTGMVQRFKQEAATISLPPAARQVAPDRSRSWSSWPAWSRPKAAGYSDYPKIARVIYNRLSARYAPPLDSTVLYGLNKYGIIASEPSSHSSSPYNTYKHKGLAPGPIDSPGDAAIEAVLHPAVRQLALLRDGEPEDRRDPLHLEPGPVRAVPAELERNLAKG